MAPRYGLAGFVALPLFVFAAGCAVEADDAGGFEENSAGDVVFELDDPGAIAEATSALCTESGAADVSSALQSGGINGIPMWGILEATSPDTLYGSAACSGRFVVEGTQVNNWPSNWQLYAKARLASSSSLPESACAASVVNMLVYVQLTTLGNLWFPIGEYSAQGEWNGSSCVLATSAPINLSGVRTVRVAAKAYRPFLGAQMPLNVTATVWKTSMTLE